jgi:DNA-nicking Smr family endonuclease
MSSKNKINDGEIFRQAVADVTPLPESGRIDPEPAKTPPKAFQQELDDREAFRELLDGDHLDEPETGEELSWLKPGYQQRILKRLRKGQYSVVDTIDLHHMDVDTARQVLIDFIENAVQRNHGCIRVIHGKGLRSRDIPRLKVLTNRILFRHPRVVAYASCRPVDGGTGATDILLSSPPGVRK